MADSSSNRNDTIKEINVRFIDDSDIHNLIQPLDNAKVKKKKKRKENDTTPLSDAKTILQKKTRLSALKNKFTKSRKATHSNNKQKKHSYREDSSSEEDDSEKGSDVECLELNDKPTSLFEDDDVSGKQMFGFQTPKRKGAMALKASESASKTTPTRKAETETITPKQKKVVNSCIPLSVSLTRLEDDKNKADVMYSKTPYSLRNNLKRRISSEKLREVLSSESDYSGSDFNVESDGDTSQESSESSSEDEATPSTTPRRLMFSKSAPVTASKCKKKDLKYVFTSDEYFESHAHKVKTSDHTLSRLRTPRLTQDAMNSLLQYIPHSHESSVRSLVYEHMARFNSWRFYLSQGFSILVYGLGSKRSLLNNFHKEMLSNSLTLVVNGFFPSLTIKEIVDSIAGDLLGLKNIPPHPLAAVAWIESKLTCSSKRVFLIVHNLDGPMLRSEKSQMILARLASISRLHLVASVDHINCPLLWDHSKLSHFNFIWEDATSFLPYSEETSFETSLMVQRSGSLALASLTNVFKSLTKNAREIFKLLLEDHLSNKSNQKYIGIPLSELYRQSRDAMLVTSDLALRTQLTEFLDHQLVKWRRDSDHLYIPVDSTVLKQFQTELDESEL